MSGDYLAEAEFYERKVRELDAAIAAHVNKAFAKHGNSQLPMVKLEGDLAFTSAISDRNRYIQMSIMYSSLAAAQMLRARSSRVGD